MTAVETLNQISDATAARSIDCKSVHERLATLEQNTPLYSSWLIAPSAASLSRLFGGDWSVFAVVLIAATAGTLIRMQLGPRHLNPFAIPFLVALLSGVIAGIGINVHPASTQYLCLLAPGMILVPGVPLTTGFVTQLATTLEWRARSSLS